MRIVTCAALLALMSTAAMNSSWAADPTKPVKIGVLNDMSSVYADFQGAGSVLAAQMAAEDYMKASKRKVEVIFADHQNKPDIGANMSRQWYDVDNVDVIADLPNSAVALAVNQIAKDKNKVVLGSGAGSSALTGEQCSANFVHWTYDTWSYGHSAARAAYEQGGKKWYFITADYAFGHDLEKQASDEIKALGGTIIGAVRHPVGAADFSSFLLQAQSSGADVVAFANAGGDLTNSLKQAAEFGMAEKQKVVGLIFGVTNVPALGLKAVQGLQSVAPFYWDLNDGTREWSKRFQARHAKKMMPNDMHAGVYAAVVHYLKAVDKVGDATDGRAVVAAMKAMPTDDALFGKGTIRIDGRKLHPMFLLEAKKPAESKGDWDFLKVVATVPADKAFRPLADGNCPLAK